MEAVPAVMASTWEWISCLDSSILFLRQAWDAFQQRNIMQEKGNMSHQEHVEQLSFSSSNNRNYIKLLIQIKKILFGKYKPNNDEHFWFRGKDI